MGLNTGVSGGGGTKEEEEEKEEKREIPHMCESIGPLPKRGPSDQLTHGQMDVQRGKHSRMLSHIAYY